MPSYYFPSLPHDGGPPIQQRPPIRQEAEEQALLAVMTSHPDQGRVEMLWNATLTAVAEAHAQDMIARDFFAHENPDGVNANGRVIDAGHGLPDNYLPTANNIESLAGGHGLDTAAKAWELWMQSPTHRAHLLAEDEFFESQIMVGIAHAYDPNSTWFHYWVVVTAPVPR